MRRGSLEDNFGSSGSRKLIEVGDIAPDAEFDIGTDHRVKLSDWRGRTIVLYFYPKDDTSGCTTEAKDFTALSKDFGKADAIVIGVSKDSITSHIKFKNKYGLTHILGSDGDGILCAAFGVWVEKSMYGRKYMGIERATFRITPDGRIAQIWRKVKVSSHAESVLKSIAQ